MLNRIFRVFFEKRESLHSINKFLSSFLPTRFLYTLLKEKHAKLDFFLFNGVKLKYFWHSYNTTALVERTIEIPILRYYMEKFGGRDFLEIGNVSNHYYSYFQNLIDSKVVVDRYEKGWGVINKDIKDFTSKEQFNFIYSISTFEHMDSDRGNNPNYIKGKSKSISYAADNIVYVCNNLLKKGGVFILTAAMGLFNEWDKTIFSNDIFNVEFLKVKSIKVYFLKKLSEIKWLQIDIKSVYKARNTRPLPNANMTVIIEIIK